MSGKKEFHIIGAGVAGLGIGWRLAQRGHRVTVFDKGEAGKGASWAAAGMLASILESEPGEESLLPFLLEAQNLWPDFVKEISDFTGLDIGYRQTGTIFAACERDDAGILRQRYDFLQKNGVTLEWLERETVRAREPFLSPRVYSALYSPGDHQVDNRALTLALHAACLASGVTIRSHAPVSEIMSEGGHVAALRCMGDMIPAQNVVLCAGAWSAEIRGAPEVNSGNLPPVYPLKGQMLALQMDPKHPILTHVLWTPRVYLVPRKDGRLVIGATMEDRGFESLQRAGSVLHLLRETFEVLPGMEELPLAESWTGLRPSSRDDAPILGPTGIKGLSIATGQHRHGILMTPLIAGLMADYLITGKLGASARPYTLARFG